MDWLHVANPSVVGQFHYTRQQVEDFFVVERERVEYNLKRPKCFEPTASSNVYNARRSLNKRTREFKKKHCNEMEDAPAIKMKICTSYYVTMLYIRPTVPQCYYITASATKLIITHNHDIGYTARTNWVGYSLLKSNHSPSICLNTKPSATRILCHIAYCTVSSTQCSYICKGRAYYGHAQPPGTWCVS